MGADQIVDLGTDPATVAVRTAGEPALSPLGA
jgi:hypothetical protein